MAYVGGIGFSVGVVVVPHRSPSIPNVLLSHGQDRHPPRALHRTHAQRARFGYVSLQELPWKFVGAGVLLRRAAHVMAESVVDGVGHIAPRKLVIWITHPKGVTRGLRALGVVPHLGRAHPTLLWQVEVAQIILASTVRHLAPEVTHSVGQLARLGVHLKVVRNGDKLVRELRRGEVRACKVAKKVPTRVGRARGGGARRVDLLRPNALLAVPVRGEG
mmetsp:Transcript_18813/g.49332  ORF Transcript_18813/g.49332 Transcript_18813/m.49332 type:complete len:218 (+) Transcript_18813:87-740(+)